MLISVGIAILVSCNFSQSPSETPIPSATITIKRTIPPISLTSTPSPTPTPTPTVIQNSSIYPVAYPLSPLTKDQILEVGMCDIANLAAARYPEVIIDNQFDNQFTPTTSCDWAVLAFAFALQNETDIPNPYGVEAYLKAVEENYGYTLATPIFYTYFGSISLVENPEFANQEIKEIELNYYWSGLGEPSNLEYTLSIIDANTTPIIESDSPLVNKDITINKELIQSLRLGLNDLLPIESEISIAPCTDNYPQWQVKITFMDNSEVTLYAISNFLSFGGPWETAIGDQSYLQMSSAFPDRLADLVDVLELPLGEPFAMTCFGDSVFEKAYSNSLPPTSTPEPDLTAEAINTFVMQTVEALLSQTPTP